MAGSAPAASRTPCECANYLRHTPCSFRNPCILADRQGKIKLVIKKILKQPLFWIFILALFLRTYKLSSFPVGFHADEVRVGWNALSILKTGKDDRGKALALYYNTFGDFRPTGIFYLTIPSIAIFGRSEFAVRFPSAFLGALTVFPLFLFAKELLKKKNLALSAGFLLAINPWHISTSRATSEVVMALFFTLWGLTFFLKKKYFYSLLFLVVSYFFYHSIRALAPMFAFAMIVKNKIITKPAIIIFLLLSLVTCLLSLNKDARARFSQVSIFNDLDVKYELSRMPFEEGPNKVFVARFWHNKPSVYVRRFVNEYAKYFSSDFFLVSERAKPTRYQTVGIGLITYMELILFIAGLVAIAKKNYSILPLILLLLAPIPASLTTEDAPNLHRALFMVPFITIIGAYGLDYIKTFALPVRQVGFFFLIFNFIFFLHMYFVHSKVHLPLYRNVGAKELAVYLNKVQKDYDRIILTNIPDDPYPWIAYFTGQNPKIFNRDAVTREKGVWQTQNLLFTGQRCPSRDAFTNPDVKRLLVVDAEGCATESNLKDRTDIKLEKIFRPDESEVYNLWSKVVP